MQRPDFTVLLREKKFKATPGRVELLTTLWEQAKPISVFALAKKLEKSMDEATVYRALEALASSGIIRRVDLGHGHTHYEFEKSHHHHIVCMDCGVVEDITDDAVEKQLTKMTGGSKRFKSIYSHNIEFFGSCNSCLSTNNSN